MKNLSSKVFLVIRVFLIFIMIFGGVQHFIKPEFYIPFVPSFLPCNMCIIYLSGVVEIALGVLLVFNRFAQIAAMGIFLLLISFLPIHVWDLFSETPAIGSFKAAIIRLPFQFIFIFMAWKLKTYSSKYKK